MLASQKFSPGRYSLDVALQSAGIGMQRRRNGRILLKRIRFRWQIFDRKLHLTGRRSRSVECGAQRVLQVKTAQPCYSEFVCSVDCYSRD